MAEPPAEKPARRGATSAKTDWKSLHLWQIQWVRDVLVVLGVIGLFWLGQKISVVTVPLLLAILLAYLFEPVIRWLIRKTGWQRQGSVAAVMIAAILIVVIPAAVGLTFGVAQSIRLVRNVSNKANLTYDAVVAGRALEAAQADLAEMTAPPETGEPAPRGESGAEPGAPGTGAGPADDRRAPDQPGGALPAEVGEVSPELDAAGALDEAARAQASPEPRTVAEARERVDRLKSEFEERLDRVEDRAGGFYRRAAEFIDEQGSDTIDNAFDTMQRWVRANAEQIATAGAGAVRTTLRFLGGLFGVLFMGFVTAFFFYFIATGWVELQHFGDRVLPEKHRPQILDLLLKFDRVISAFIRGRLTIAFLQSIVFTVGYFIIGVPAAFILGPAVAVLSIVPYLALVGVPVSITLLALEGHDGIRGQWWWIVGAPTVFYFIAQALDDYLWTPMIQGKSTDMSTPMILFASLAGGVLFGVFGLLIAIPIAACIKILVQEIFWPRFKAWGEGKEKDFLPIGRE